METFLSHSLFFTDKQANQIHLLSPGLLICPIHSVQNQGKMHKQNNYTLCKKCLKTYKFNEIRDTATIIILFQLNILGRGSATEHVSVIICQMSLRGSYAFFVGEVPQSVVEFIRAKHILEPKLKGRSLTIQHGPNYKIFG